MKRSRLNLVLLCICLSLAIVASMLAGFSSPVIAQDATSDEVYREMNGIGGDPSIEPMNLSEPMGGGLSCPAGTVVMTTYITDTAFVSAVPDPNGQWEFGIPALLTDTSYTLDLDCDVAGNPDNITGPPNVPSGGSVWATDLDGCYPPLGASQSLLLDFNFPTTTTCDGVDIPTPDIQLGFQYWYQAYTTFDPVFFEADGTQVYADTAGGPGDIIGWSPFMAMLASNGTFEFIMSPTTVVQYPGLYIDFDQAGNPATAVSYCGCAPPPMPAPAPEIDKSSTVNGNMIDYTVTVTNTGDLTGTISVTDTIPAGVSMCMVDLGSVSQTSVITASLSDDAYDGTMGSMTCTDIDLSALPTIKTVANVTVDVNVEHTWIGDLVMRLFSPAGTDVTLMDRPGYIGPDDGLGGFGDSTNLDGTPITFTDAGLFDAETMGASVGTGDFVCTTDGECSFQPNSDNYPYPANALANFDGEAAAGTWTFCVGDAAGGDLGMINGWTINFDSGIPIDDASGFLIDVDVPLGIGQSASATVSCMVDGGIVASKTPDSQIASVNAPHNFTISITNTASTTMTNIALVDSPVAGCPGSLVPPLPMDLGPGASYMGTCMAPGAMVTYTNFITATGDIVVENTAEASAGGVTVSDTVSDAIGFMDMDSAEVSVIDPTVVSMIGSQANATTWNTLLIITVIPALLIATVVAVRRRNWSN